MQPHPGILPSNKFIDVVVSGKKVLFAAYSWSDQGRLLEVVADPRFVDPLVAKDGWLIPTKSLSDHAPKPSPLFQRRVGVVVDELETFTACLSPYSTASLNLSMKLEVAFESNGILP